MKKWMAILDQFWFPVLAPERLALLRIATGLLALWYLLVRFDMLLGIAASSARLFEPVGLAELLPGPMAPPLFLGLLLLTILAGIFYTLGWQFRFSGPAFALLLLLLMSYRNSWSMIYHNYNGLILHVFVIGFAAAADALALDARKRRSGPHWQYGWPVVLIGALTATTYLLSGLAKVYSELAWDWVQGEAMRSQVAVDALRKVMLGGGEPKPLFLWLYPHTQFFLLFGLLSMVLELGAPLALLHRKLGYAWVLLTWGMHWGIYLIMGIIFPYHLTGLIFLSFLPLENWWMQLRRWREGTAAAAVAEPAPTAIVLFDGVCHFCQATVRFILARERNPHFRFASLQSPLGQELLRQHQLPTDLATMVVVAGDRVYLRSDAALYIAQQLKFPWFLLAHLRVVPRAWRDAAYQVVARNRYRWFGRADACPIPPPVVRQRFLDQVLEI